jgi:hypothetical protein
VKLLGFGFSKLFRRGSGGPRNGGFRATTASGPTPIAPTPAAKPAIGHGIEDLSNEERAKWEQSLHTQTAAPVVQQRYVTVPATDYKAEGYRRALAAEVRNNDQLKHFAERLETQAQHLADSLRASDRMFATERK